MAERCLIKLESHISGVRGYLAPMKEFLCCSMAAWHGYISVVFTAEKNLNVRANAMGIFFVRSVMLNLITRMLGVMSLTEAIVARTKTLVSKLNLRNVSGNAMYVP